MNPLARFLDSFCDRSILVVGDLMLDDYLWGRIEGISPEAPVPVLSLIRRESTLGGAGNVLRNLSSLGATVFAAGVVGQGSTGQQILELLDVLGADADAVVTDRHRKSTRKTRLMSIEHGQQVFRLDEESVQGIWSEVEDELIEKIRTNAEDVHAILCSDYQKGLLTTRVLQAVFEAARRQHVPAIVAPKSSDAAKFRGASILMPNERELAQLVGVRVNGHDWLTDAARRLVEQLDLQALVVTRGRDGMCLFEPGQSGLRRMDVPTVAQNVYDITGAGDTAIATFTLAVASGADCQLAAELANRAAGVVLGKRGTASITVEEIRARLPEASMDAVS